MGFRPSPSSGPVGVYRVDLPAGLASCPVSRAYVVALPVDDLAAADRSGGRDEVGEAGRCVGAHARDEVLVGGHGEAGVGVAESF